MSTPISWGTEFLINTATKGSQSEPTITALPDGRFVVAWTDLSQTGGDNSGSAIRGQIYNADGSRVGTEFLVNTTTSSSQDQPTITATADGGFLVAWRDSSQNTDDTSLWGVRGQAFDANGGKVGPEFLANISGSRQAQPKLTALTDGRLVVTWVDTSQTGGDASGSAIRAQMLNGDGSKAGSEFLVNTSIFGDQADPTITALPGGGFVVAWNEPWEVRAQVFAADGRKVGGEFLVNTNIMGLQARPAITALLDGRFIVAWTDDNGDGSGTAIRGQIFNADGGRVGTEFVINTTVTGAQDRPKITALPDGRFVVVWDDSSSTGGDVSAHAVRGQIFNSDGSKAGSEFLVNTNIMGLQARPAITALLDGRFVVAWEDDSATGGDLYPLAIRGQILDARTEAITLNGTLADDAYIGTIFADTLRGNFGNDHLRGEAGDDFINGEEGADHLFGGLGNDILHGGDDSDTLFGESGSDRLHGDAGNDTLDGGVGADRLEGGTGDDTYIVDNALDLVLEAAGSGTDTVLAGTSYALNASAEIEVLATSNAAAAIHLTGSQTANAIHGNAGANLLKGEGGVDTLDGGAGADTLMGGADSDSYFIDAADQVIEAAGGGVADRVYADFSYTLGAEVEQLFATGVAAITLTGNALSNLLVGNGAGNVLYGGAGRDTLKGGDGNDVLYGHSGKDVFVFDTMPHKSTTRDTIADFKVKDDSIWLDNAIFKKLGKKGTELKPAKLDKKFFVVGSKAKDKNDYLVYDKKKGILSYDADGSGKGKAVEIATLSKNLKLTDKDFFVI